MLKVLKAFCLAAVFDAEIACDQPFDDLEAIRLRDLLVRQQHDLVSHMLQRHNAVAVGHCRVGVVVDDAPLALARTTVGKWLNTCCRHAFAHGQEKHCGQEYPGRESDRVGQ